MPLSALAEAAIIRNTIARGVRANIQPDSIRRALNRQGISTSGLGLRGRVEAQRVVQRNTELLQSRRTNYRPGPGRGMIKAVSREPFDYRYVVNVTYRDLNTGQLVTEARSVSSNIRLTVGQAQRQALADARLGLLSPRGKSDPRGRLQALSSLIEQSYDQTL